MAARCRFCRPISDAQTLNLPEVIVTRNQSQPMMKRGAGNPDVVFGYWPASLFQPPLDEAI